MRTLEEPFIFGCFYVNKKVGLVPTTTKKKPHQKTHDVIIINFTTSSRIRKIKPTFNS